METLEKKIAKINEDFDKKQTEMLAKLAEERAMAIAKETVNDTVKNLPSMSMGSIISIFENISPVLIKSKGGKNRINAFVSLVKEDKNIHSFYVIKESMNGNVGIDNPKEFINEMVSVANETYNKAGYKESKDKLAKFVSEAILSVSPDKVSGKIKVNEATEKMCNNIETLVCGKKTIKNTAARLKSLNEAVEFLSKKSNDESKEDVFEHYKTECINSINEAWEGADVNVRMKLTEMKDRISKKMYSELTVDDDIKYMKELIETVR